MKGENSTYRLITRRQTAKENLDSQTGIQGGSLKLHETAKHKNQKEIQTHSQNITLTDRHTGHTTDRQPGGQVYNQSVYLKFYRKCHSHTKAYKEETTKGGGDVLC